MSLILKSFLLKSHHFNEYKANHFHFLWYIHMVDGMIVVIFPSFSFITKHPGNDKRAVYPETWDLSHHPGSYFYFICVGVCVCVLKLLLQKNNRGTTFCLSPECMSVLWKHFIFQRFQGLYSPCCYSLY